MYAWYMRIPSTGRAQPGGCVVVLLAALSDSYTSYSPSLAARRVDAVLRATADYIAQSGYYRQDSKYLRTRLAMMLYAYQCLTHCLYPAMPTLCEHRQSPRF